MNVSSINRLTQALATSGVSATSTSASSDLDALSGDGTTTDLSGAAQWMSQLEALARSDPTKFKELTSEISDKLKEAASQTTGDDADALSKLADKFSKASSSGSLDALRPDGPPPGPPPDTSSASDQDSDQDDDSASTGTSATSSTRSSANHKVKKYASRGTQESGGLTDALRSEIDQLIQGVLGESSTATATSPTASGDGSSA